MKGSARNRVLPLGVLGGRWGTMDPTEKGYPPFEEGGSVETVASEGAEVPAEGDGPLRPEGEHILLAPPHFPAD